MTETVMAGYRIETTTLTRKSGGKDVTTTGQSGLVNTRSELKSFIEDYKKYVHHCPMALLSNSLSREFVDWFERHEARRKSGRFEAAGSLLGLFASIISGNAASIASSGLKTAGVVASDLRYEKEEHEFLMLTFHLRYTYSCGKTGVFLDMTREGGPYETTWGDLGTAWTFARLRGERFVG